MAVCSLSLELTTIQTLYRKYEHYAHVEEFYPAISEAARDAIYVLRFIRQTLIETHADDGLFTIVDLEIILDNIGFDDQGIHIVIKALSSIYNDFESFDFDSLEKKELTIIAQDMMAQYIEFKNNK